MNRFDAKFSSGNANPSELMVICQSLKRDIAKYNEEHDYLESILERNGIELPKK
jgi:hypothetical protein